MQFNSIIEKCLDHKIPVAVKRKDGQTLFEIGGFYKSGTVTLYDNHDCFTAVDRYGAHTEIRSIVDLVRLNYDWWIRSCDRGRTVSGYFGHQAAEVWEQPDHAWIPLLLEAGLIREKKQEVVYEPWA